MNPAPDPWTRLIASARRAPAEEPLVSVPFGFPSRVVALAFSQPERPWVGLVEQFSWRALGLAAGLALASAALNLAPAVQAFQHDLFIEQDPVALLELSR
jgi:hypothetical protein